MQVRSPYTSLDKRLVIKCVDGGGGLETRGGVASEALPLEKKRGLGGKGLSHAERGAEQVLS